MLVRGSTSFATIGAPESSACGGGVQPCHSYFAAVGRSGWACGSRSGLIPELKYAMWSPLMKNQLNVYWIRQAYFMNSRGDSILRGLLKSAKPSDESTSW